MKATTEFCIVWNYATQKRVNTLAEAKAQLELEKDTLKKRLRDGAISEDSFLYWMKEKHSIVEVVTVTQLVSEGTYDEHSDSVILEKG